MVILQAILCVNVFVNWKKKSVTKPFGLQKMRDYKCNLRGECAKMVGTEIWK